MGAAYVSSQTIPVFPAPYTTCSSCSLSQSVAASQIDVAAVSLISKCMDAYANPKRGTSLLSACFPLSLF
jgi:hypothetical protein